MLDQVNQAGPQLCQISPGEGAQTIESLVTRDNRRFEAIVEQVQRKAERLRLTKQKNIEIVGDIDELLDWFREVRTSLAVVKYVSAIEAAECFVVRLEL